MGLADDLDKAKDLMRSRPSTKCSIAVLLELLDERDRAALEEVFSDDSYRSTTIVTFLNGFGDRMLASTATPSREEQQIIDLCRRMGSNTIQRHRRGGCQCQRNAQ